MRKRSRLMIDIEKIDAVLQPLIKEVPTLKNGLDLIQKYAIVVCLNYGFLLHSLKGLR